MSSFVLGTPVLDISSKSDVGETTMQAPRSVRKEWSKHCRTAIPLRLMIRWQAELLQPLEINGGEKYHLQPLEDSTLEDMAAPKEVHDDKGRPHQSNPSLGGLKSVEGNHVLGEVFEGLSPVGGMPCCHWRGL